MHHIDFSPLYRSTVGFDRLFSMIDSLGSHENTSQNTYPPYNIERTGDDAYRITMAVAGFSEDDISLEAKENVLTVRADKTETSDDKNEVLYRGIAARSFERRFQLADHVEVRGALLENGLLHVNLVREIPETMKPRTIAITTSKASKTKQIDDEAK